MVCNHVGAKNLYTVILLYYTENPRWGLVTGRLHHLQCRAAIGTNRRPIKQPGLHRRVLEQPAAFQSAQVAPAAGLSPWGPLWSAHCGGGGQPLDAVTAQVREGRGPDAHGAIVDRLLLAVLLEPGDDVSEDDLDVVVRLAGCEAVPHSWVQSYGLVPAAGLLVQCLAHLRVRHHVCFPVQHEERQVYLQKKVIDP